MSEPSDREKMFWTLVTVVVGVIWIVQGIHSKKTVSPDELEDVALRLSYGLPQTVDDQTELLAVEASNQVLIFRHRLVKADAASFDWEQFAQITPLYKRILDCMSEGRREEWLERGVILRYAYVDRADKKLGHFDITRETCDEPAPER